MLAEGSPRDTPELSCVHSKLESGPTLATRCCRSTSRAVRKRPLVSGVSNHMPTSSSRLAASKLLSANTCVMGWVMDGFIVTALSEV